MRIILLALCVWLCQASTEPCNRPKITNGFLVPVKSKYDHHTKVSYSCNSGMKTALKTWWGELLCDNGKWSHIPHCVPVTDCIVPDVKNSKPLQARVSYPDNSNVTFICNEGYKAEGQRDVQVTCKNQVWSKVPDCKRDASACSAPDKVNNAMITKPYQGTFEHGDTVDYVCQKGFRLEGNKTSTCLNGEWTGDPIQCVKVMTPAEPKSPKNPRNPSDAESTGREAGSRSPSNTDPAITHVGDCGDYPAIENGDFIEEAGGRNLKAMCAALYKLEGPEKVMCVFGQWSNLPVCKAPCKLDQSRLFRSQRKYLIHGEQDKFYCGFLEGSVNVKCVNGNMYYEGCGYSSVGDVGA